MAITLPDGRTETFDLTLTPAYQGLVPIEFPTPVWQARPGTFSRLDALTDNDLWVVGGAVEVLHFDEHGDLAQYDPRRYRLTTPEGMVFTLDQNFGVRTITEPNGNTLTFGTNGIAHSAGKSVAFARDAQGRITQITDPNGTSITYAYDAHGDLEHRSRIIP